MAKQNTLCSDNILALTKRLCAYRTGVVGFENEALFAELQRELPFQLHQFSSGDEYLGWTLPKGWKVKKALIRCGGKIVYDGTASALGVALYSRSFTGTISLEELQAHVSTNKKFSEAHVFHCMWQYRPWQADWAFSIPYTLFSQFKPGCYEVELKTEYHDGKMLCAEYTLPGESEKTIIFNSHTCHPHMANDGLSGAATLIRLFQLLQQAPRFYTYKLCLWPEHLGTVFYLRDNAKEILPKAVSGVFYEMGGIPAPLKATSTFLGNQMLDKAFQKAFQDKAKDYVHVPWRQGAGNDETVWEAPGYEVPFVELTRARSLWDPFHEYHSDFDTPESLDLPALQESADVLQQLVFILENNYVLERTFDGLVCLSNPKYNLYHERPDPSVHKEAARYTENWGYLSDCMFRYFDGSLSLLDIALRHELPFDDILEYFSRFQEKGLLRMHRAEIPSVKRGSFQREGSS